MSKASALFAYSCCASSPAARSGAGEVWVEMECEGWEHGKTGGRGGPRVSVASDNGMSTAFAKHSDAYSLESVAVQTNWLGHPRHDGRQIPQRSSTYIGTAT
eukprot:2471173-Pleurochrysis_carterae.AAC.2